MKSPNHQAASPWVEHYASRVRDGGLVLDLACGGGRHTRLFRGLGYRVVAVDVDVSGLGDLRGDESVEIIEADLESGGWPLGDRQFDGIVVTNYLYRPHLPFLLASLHPGGVLIYETFATGHEKFGRPRNPAFLLEPGELIEAFVPQLEIIAYEHGTERDPSPAVRQRLCAIKPVDRSQDPD